LKDRRFNQSMLGLFSVLSCAMVLVLLSVIPALAGFTTNKTATPVANTCSSYQVQLSITGSNPPQKAIDAIIVIDRSGSMAGDSIVNAKIAAKQFAASVLANPNSRVALVSYSSTATVNQVLTNNLSSINTRIDGLSAGGTTNVKDGFDKARGEMQTRGRPCSDINRVIVFLTDGVANEGAGSCTAWPTAHTPCTIAGYLAGQTAQESGLTTVFTIGLLGGVSSTHPESLAVARDTMQKAQNGGYFETLSAPDLTAIFQAIFQQLNFVIKNVVVTDSVSANFVLNPASLNPSKGTTSLAGSVITWTIGLVGNETVTLSYTIDPVANVSGPSLPTNQSASVAYSDPYCVAGTAFFPNPTVEVHPCCSVAAQPAGGSFNLSTVVTGGKAPLTYSWSDQGEGGTWNPDANVPNPTWNPPAGWDGTATLALTVTDANNMQSNCSVMVMAVSGSLQGQIWFDNNGDGSQAGGDLGLSGVVVQLYDAGNNMLETTATDGSGNYFFSNLSPGTYTVVVIPDPRWQITHDPSGIPPLQSTWTGALSGGQVINNLEFGYTRLDFGDAPDSFGTLTVSNGPRHTVIDGGIFLGALIDSEVDGIPNASATGDDISNLADEDGVTFPMPLARGFNATIKVTASAAGSLDAWIDFNQNGSFSDAGEQIFNAQGLSAGVNTLTLSVPIGAIAGDTYSRFRFSSSGGLAPTGWAPDGEVEDYLIPIYDPGSISGYVWTDLNGDGIWQDSEPAVSGATVNLYARQNPAEPADDTLNPYVIVNTTVSGMDGLYSFNDLLPVHYIVEVILPDGYTGFTIQNNPAAPDCRDSHVDPATGQTGKMRITSGRIITCVNAGLVPANPSLSVTKTATETAVAVGQTIHYTIIIKNTGNVLLTNVSFADTKIPPPPMTINLGPGETINIELEYIVQPEDLPGPVVNTVIVGSDQTDAVSATESVDIIALSLTKTAQESTVRVGETIHYFITVKNEGSATLTNVVVNDPVLGFSQTIVSLAAGDSQTFTPTYTVQVSDLPGPINNTASADSDQTGPLTAGATVDIAGLTLNKSVAETIATVGQTVHYTIEVSNIGSVDLSNVIVSDPKIGFTTIIASLLAGTSQTFNPTYVVQAGDLPGPLLNTASAYTPQTGEITDQTSVDLAALSLTKSALESAVKVGDTIHYSLTVKNEGNVTLTYINITDPKLGINSTIPSLDPGSFQTISGSYQVTDADLPGPVVNTATADSDQTDPVTAGTGVAVYSLAIDKSAPAGPFKLGQTVPYQIKIWNAGSAELSNVVLNDAKLGIVNQLIGTLPVTNNVANPIVINSFYGPISEADLGPNPIHNTATADSDQTDPAVSDSCDVPVAAVKISKTGPTTMTIGQTIQYTITVQNLGSAVLTNVLVQDPRIGINWSIAQLPVGAVLSQQFPYVVKAEDIPGPIHNNATVTTAQTDPGSDTWITPLDPAPRGKMVGSGTIKTGTSFQVDVVSWPGATAPQGNLVYKDISRGISLTGTASYVAINPQTKEVVYGGPVSGTPRNAATFKVYLQDGGTKDTFKIWLYDTNGAVIYSAGGPVLIGQISFRVAL